MQVICVTTDLVLVNLLKNELRDVACTPDLSVYSEGNIALENAKGIGIKVAILDLRLLAADAIGLSLRLKEVDPNVSIVFAKCVGSEHFEFWSLEEDSFSLKPYLITELVYIIGRKTSCEINAKSKLIRIETIPRLLVTVDGIPFHFSREKVREMFALLVDYGARGITTKEAISYLWPDRPNDKNTQTLFRVTYKRLLDVLKEEDIDYILASEENHRMLKVGYVDCDLYRILSGDMQTAKKYDGKYLQEYSWAEERNGQLYRMLLEK